MVGGLSQLYELVDGFEDIPKDEKGCPENYPNLLVEKIENQSKGGGKFLNKAWLYDGAQWTEVEEMSSQRDNPLCSLIQMADEEVRKK